RSAPTGPGTIFPASTRRCAPTAASRSSGYRSSSTVPFGTGPTAGSAISMRSTSRSTARSEDHPMSSSPTLARTPAPPGAEAMRIGGERLTRPLVIEVLNPYTEDLVGTVPRADVEDVRRAFAIAGQYQASLTRNERAEILRKTADILVARKEAISDLITAESGLCKKDTLYEVGRAYDAFLLSAQQTLLDDSQPFSCDITPHGQRRRIHTLREPLRAISAITPFNHPLNQVAHKVAPAIATNNKMVLKPSEKTPLTALLLADILYEAGLPPAMFQV